MCSYFALKVFGPPWCLCLCAKPFLLPLPFFQEVLVFRGFIHISFLERLGHMLPQSPVGRRVTD